MLSLYITRVTWLHRQPVGGKLLGLAASSILVLWAANLWLNFFLLFVVILGFLSLGAAGQRRLIGLIKTLMPLLLVLFAAQWILQWIAGVPPMQALQASTTTFTQLFGLVALADLVTATTTIAQMLEVFKRLLSPLRLIGLKQSTIESMALAVGLMIRMVALLTRDWHEVRAAFAARGRHRPGIGVVPVLMRRQLLRGQLLEAALLARRSSRPEASPPAEAIRAKPS